MKLTAVSTTGTKSTVTASDAVFAAPVNQQLLAQAVRVYIANSHQSTSRVQTRSEVTRTKKKWFKQKGTGNARHGARSAPIFVGGGVTHGPKGAQAAPLTLSQKQKHSALRIALSAQNQAVIISEGLEKLSNKTAESAQALAKVGVADGLVLIIISEVNDTVGRGLRNIPFVKLVSASQVTAYEVSAADQILISPEALTVLTERLTGKAKKSVAKAKAKSTAKKTESKKPAKKTAATKTTKKTTKTSAAKKQTKTTKKTEKK